MLVNSNNDEKVPFELTINESVISAGTSHITVKGNRAFLNGDLGTKTYIQIQDLIKTQPQVDTIVIQEVLGSMALT